MEMGVGDGTVRRFGPGDVVIVEALTGQGHTASVVGDHPCCRPTCIREGMQ
jgi:hypothetical protein